MDDGHGGLGFVDAPLVADPKLAAGRGKEFSAAHLAEQELARIEASIENGEDFRLPLNYQPPQALNTDGLTVASYDTPIPETNPGYRMLLKMGWCNGKGLGRELQGRVDPLRGGENAGMRFGLGKAEQDRFYTSEENVTRKKLGSEVLLDETVDQARERESKAARQEKIKETVKEELSTFYCELCNKQYKTAIELETHLSSYDHHHKKRLIEMKQMQSERNRGDKEKREKKHMQREMDKINQQIQRAQQHVQAPPQGDNAQPIADPTNTGEGEPATAAAANDSAPDAERKPVMAFSLGAGGGAGRSGVRGGRLGAGTMFGGRGRAGARGGLTQQKASARPTTGLSAFAMDSDSD